MRRGRPLRVNLEKARARERAQPVRMPGLDPALRERARARDGGCLLHIDLPKLSTPGDELPPAMCWGPLDPHHIKPRGRGGTDELDNLATLCRLHHDWVHAHPRAARNLDLLR